MVYTRKKEAFQMEQEKKHTRVAIQEIRESPAAGIYITKTELGKCGIFAGGLLALLSLMLLFDRRH